MMRSKNRISAKLLVITGLPVLLTLFILRKVRSRRVRVPAFVAKSNFETIRSCKLDASKPIIKLKIIGGKIISDFQIFPCLMSKTKTVSKKIRESK